jgi:homogentisate 1,2-dioxygenase
MKTIDYQHGFWNHFETEAVKGALPLGQNSPQKAPLGLYAEQLSGTPFTSPRHRNLKTWLYRKHPSVVQSKFQEVGHGTWISDAARGRVLKTPQALRFHPHPEASDSVRKDFIDSLYTYALNGDAHLGIGCAIHLYSFNESMKKKYLYNADAEMMIVPESGEMIVHTEMGLLELSPLHIGVIPRGVKFKVELKSPRARGYVCENFGQPFQLPELGPIGANGLASGRDFESPVAAYETDSAGEVELLARYQGSLWRATLPQSPLNVVAWHGNYAPYRYDLRKFNTIGTVSFDHPDPSIFTVLTSPGGVANQLVGTANVDFVIFPPRWMVAEKTFRPPYYHRNVMNEFMGLIQGQYDAKAAGFKPGGASLHNCMTGHGPDVDAFEKASGADLQPMKLENTMAFMWESSFAFWPTEQVMKNEAFVDQEYVECWQKLPVQFKG